MPTSAIAQVWDPQWWNPNQGAGPLWYYGLGWYVRGNWVAWAGGSDGQMAFVAHNRLYDITVVYLTNVLGNPMDEFMNPLLDSNGVWSSPGAPQSILGKPFPCKDDPATVQGNECTGPYGAY
jgi:hypothetical protein